MCVCVCVSIISVYIFIRVCVQRWRLRQYPCTWTVTCELYTAALTDPPASPHTVHSAPPRRPDAPPLSIPPPPPIPSFCCRQVRSALSHQQSISSGEWIKHSRGSWGKTGACRLPGLKRTRGIQYPTQGECCSAHLQNKIKMLNCKH